jgi:hypothetical protein
MRDPTTRVWSRGRRKYSAASAVIRDVAMKSRLRQRLRPGVPPGTISMRDRKYDSWFWSRGPSVSA